MPLLGRLAKPRQCLNVVLRNAFSEAVRIAQFELGGRIPLFRLLHERLDVEPRRGLLGDCLLLMRSRSTECAADQESQATDRGKEDMKPVKEGPEVGAAAGGWNLVHRVTSHGWRILPQRMWPHSCARIPIRPLISARVPGGAALPLRRPQSAPGTRVSSARRGRRRSAIHLRRRPGR